MKLLWEFIPATIKAIVGVIAFLITLGWGAAVGIHLTIKSEVASAKVEMRTIRDSDMEHLNKRLDDHNAKLDNITNILIRRENLIPGRDK